MPSDESQWGWMCYSHNVPKAELAAPESSSDWQPAELDDVQHAIIVSLCRDEIDSLDPDFRSFIEGKGRNVDEFVSGLVATTLVARRGTKFDLTTTECACAILPDGRYVAGDNNTGRFERWLARFMAYY